MATYRACSPLFGQCQDNTLESSKTVDNTTAIGKMIEVTVKPNFKETILYADDDVAEKVKIFDNADITLGIDELDLMAATEMFGFTTTEVTSNSEKVKTVAEKYDTQPNYGAFGYIYGAMKERKQTYVVVVLHRAIFDLPEEKATTMGESITFSTPSISGKAYKDVDGNWRTRCFNISTLEKAKIILEKLTKFDSIADSAKVSTSGDGDSTIEIPEDEDVENPDE